MGGGYMPRHKQTTGIIGSSLNRRAGLFVPCCMRKAAVQGQCYPADYARPETGGFFDILSCSKCGQKSGGSILARYEDGLNKEVSP